MKTIVVAGDLIRDFDLVQYPSGPERHHEGITRTLLVTQEGGAWYLKDMIDLACCDLEGAAAPRILEPRRPDGGKPILGFCVHAAYQVWSLRQKTLKEEEKVWRIGEFLGCEQVAGDGVPIKPDSHVPDVLVLDDLYIGFASRPELWPEALGRRGDPAEVVLKTSSLPEESHLWKEFVRRKLLDRLTVIVSAGLLRARGADISQGLSWDRTIEDTVREFTDGRSSQDLARCRRVVVHFGCSGAASFTRLPLIFKKHARPPKLHEFARFERFVYHPDETEGAWGEARPGRIFGIASLMTASMVRHVLNPGDYPLFLALGRGLGAARLNHEAGAGEEGHFDPRAAAGAIRKAFHPAVVDGKPADDAASEFFSAFPHQILDNKAMKRQPDAESDLLRDFTGAGLEYVFAKATEVVLCGVDRALHAAPKARYGKYITADRQEIERINAIRSLLLAYQDNAKDVRPLSIAVFGPPGSGKSFAIKQLASEFESMEFNLSQMQSVEELHRAFHQVHDASVQGQIPLVFWDEFDSDDLRWLKYFLEPMQDARFREAGIKHPFGKTIFVFAGGTSCDFGTFSRVSADPVRREAFDKSKGPDFVSRLRGFVDIKGPNPVGQCRSEGRAGAAPDPEELAEKDVAHLIRRAIMLRVALETRFKQTIDSKTRIASIDAGVVAAFLRVNEFLHGARSIDAIVSMSSVGAGRRYNVASLPSRELLALHVTDDFLEHARRGELDVPLIEALAEACHEAYCNERKAAGWTWAAERCDKKKQHPRLKPYSDLDENGKEDNRKSARVVPAKLYEIGYGIERASAGNKSRELTPKRRMSLMRIEHDIWLRDHLLSGYEWGPNSRNELRLNRDIAPFDEVPSEDKGLDRAIVETIPKVLRKYGYILVRRKSKPTRVSTR